MPESRFRLSALISSVNLPALRPVLEGLRPPLAIEDAGEDLRVEGEVLGTDVRDANRALLTALRRVEKRTRLRAEWTSDDGTRYRYFDYVLKRTPPP